MSFYCLSKRTFYFLNIKIKNIVELKQKKNFFFLIGSGIFIYNFEKKTKVEFKLYIFNSNEMKYVKLVDLDQNLSDNYLNLEIAQNNILILWKRNKIVFFFYTPNFKKIFKFILFTKAAIFSLNCLKNNLVFIDKEGFLNLLVVRKKSKCFEIYVNILKKLKISNSSILVKGVFGHYFVLIELKKTKFYS